MAVKAQTYIRGIPCITYSPECLNPSQYSFENPGNKKWFVSKYASVSAGYSFSRAGSFNYLSAPIGLQLNRKLNNNLYAFAGVSVNPTYFNFNQPIPLSGNNKSFYNSMYGPNSFDIYPRAELGLMYVNDEKTFSISGKSISVQEVDIPPFLISKCKWQNNLRLRDQTIRTITSKHSSFFNFVSVPINF